MVTRAGIERGGDRGVPIHRPRHDHGGAVGADRERAARRRRRALGTGRQVGDALFELFVWLGIGVIAAGVFATLCLIVAMIAGAV